MEHQKDSQQIHSPGKGHSRNEQQYSSLFTQRKAEKLTTALYMVTDIMSDKEPMKWKVRESGVELLSDITIASTTPASERMSILRDVMKKIERVVSFLDIAQSARMMSEMNAGVLKKEYLVLKNAVEAEWSRVHDRSRSIFSESFFEVPRESPALPAASATAPHASVHGTQTVISSATTEVLSPVRPTHLPVSQVAPTPVVAKTPERRPNAFVSSQSVSRPLDSAGRARNDGDRDDRRKIILALLKQKPALTVKDITKSIPGVSEKTIQRELLAMVAEGILIKKGERRWSTYSLRAT